MVSAAPPQARAAATTAPADVKPESRHPPFSVRASWRETGAFVGGLAALVGAFGPWFRATLVTDPPMGEATREVVTLAGPSPAPLLVALACALALPLGLAPLRPALKHTLRCALFGLAALTAIGASLLGPNGFVFGWGGVFERYEDVRPLWGVVASVAGPALAALMVGSRLLQRLPSRTEASDS